VAQATVGAEGELLVVGADGAVPKVNLGKALELHGAGRHGHRAVQLHAGARERYGLREGLEQILTAGQKLGHLGHSVTGRAEATERDAPHTEALPERKGRAHRARVFARHHDAARDAHAMCE
jgi:hypothetical protein